MPGYNRGRAAAKKKKKQQQAKKKAQALARQPSATESLARQASAAARKATEAALADAVEHERLGDAMEVECCAVKNEIAALSSPRGALHPGAAAHAASGAIGPVDADGVERRTDPSDGAGYTFEQFEEAYAERAQELWDLAGRIMLGESGPLGGAAAPLGPAPFRSFGKFQNASAAEVVKLQKLGLLDTEAQWVATEKVDGANFCISFGLEPDGAEVWGAASRNRSLALRPDEFGRDFHGHLEVLARHKGNIRSLWRSVAGAYSTARRVYVYGELCGGVYSHPRVRQDPEAHPVLKRVEYSPRMEFCPFDVFVETSDDSTAGEPGLYLPFDEMHTALREAGFAIYAEPLARGPLQTLLQFDVEGLSSTIPARLGLPPLPGPNIAEGVVLRPAGAAHHPRAMLKLKGKAFYERAPGHAEEAAKMAVAMSDGRLNGPMARAFLERVCVSRLASVRSKHSEAEWSDRKAMAAALIADAEADLELEGSAEAVAEWKALPPTCREMLRDMAVKSAFALFRQL